MLISCLFHLLLLLLLLLSPSLQWMDLDSTKTDNLVFSQMQTFFTINAQTTYTYQGDYQIACASSGCCSDAQCKAIRNANGELVRNDQDVLVQFGGAYNQNADAMTYSNTLRFFNTKQKKWSEYKNYKGDSMPSARIGHSSHLVSIKKDILRKYLYVYGGMDSSGVLMDLWQYEVAYMAIDDYPSDTTANRWRQLADGSQKRAFLNMFSYLTVLYIYAGMNENQAKTNSIYAFDMTTEAWEASAKTYQGIDTIERGTKAWDGSSYTKRSISPENRLSEDITTYASHTSPDSSATNIPSQRSMAASTQSTNFLYFLGGLSSTNAPLNDFWQLDLITFKFLQIFNTKDHNQFISYWPNPTYGAQIQLYSDDKIIFMYGGVNAAGMTNELWEYRIEQNSWLNIPFSHFYINPIQTETVGHCLIANRKGIILYNGLKVEKDASAFTATQLSMGILAIDYSGQSLSFSVNNKKAKGQYVLMEVDRDSHCNPQYISRGKCLWGRLQCDSQYMGQQCEMIQCANSFCYYDPYSLSKASCLYCSKHGVCLDGKCKCDDGYSSSENGCMMSGCQDNCSVTQQVPDAGSCVSNFPQSQCDCNQSQKRGGDNCSNIFCLNDCTNNGSCVQGTCQVCKTGYTGEDCSIYIIDINI